MESFAVVVFFLSFVGPVSGWFMIYGFSTMYTNLAVATGNKNYLALASFVSGTNVVLVGSLLVLAAIMIAAVFGLRNTFRYQWATFVVMIIGLAVFLLALAGASPATFKANFNALSGADYDGLIKAATGAGMVTTFTLGGTIAGSFYSFLNYIGYYLSSYVGGEVRQSQRSQFIGIIGSTLVFAVIVFLVFGAPYPVMGGQFINALSQLAASSNPAYTLPSAPVTSYLVIFANPSAIVGVLVPLGIIAAVLGSLETLVLASVRIVFAWSFDGVAPTKLADISERRGTPYYVLAIVAVVSLIYIILSIYAASVLTFLAYATSGIFLSIAIVGIAGIVFPYRHKDLFLSTPPNVQRRIGGVPVITILGVVTFLTGIFVAYVAASPIITNVPINPFYILGLALVFIAGLALYYASYYYHKGKGLDLSLRFKEIPPE
jgi:APA family basic amino acid/polyamine antiporter